MPGFFGPFGPGGPFLRQSFPAALTTPQDGTDTPLPLHEELLLSAIILPGDRTKEGALIEAIAFPWLRILKELERDPDLLQLLKPRQLEELVAGAWAEEGKQERWRVELTPSSGDKGRDVIVTARLAGIGEIRIIDQVKKFAAGHVVTADDVRAVGGVLLRDQDVTKAIITTTSTFAPGVPKEWAAFIPTRLELKDGPALHHWLREIALKT